MITKGATHYFLVETAFKIHLAQKTEAGHFNGHDVSDYIAQAIKHVL